jgi:hypothetical protein
MREPLPVSGAEQHNFGLQCRELFEVGRRELLEAAHWPWSDPLRREQQMRRVSYLVDFDETRTVGGYRVERRGRVRVQFQFDGSLR